MDVSVIVCTRNRADSLERCLASIAADPSSTSAEVIVVDNASADHTGDVVRAAMETSPRRLRMVWTSERGHSRARNVGISGAMGRLLLFTDDDVEVQRGWIDAMARAFEDLDVGAAGGRIIPTYLSERPGWLTDDPVFQPITLPDYGLEPFLFEDGRWPIGANMAIRASLLRPDPFDARLGHTGKLGIGFDEFDVVERIARNHTVAYVPDAEVWHMLAADRLTLAAARRTLLQIGFGKARWHRLLGTNVPSLPRRIAGVVRAWLQLHHMPKTDVAAELRAWQHVGEQTEWLLGPRVPWLSNWCAAHFSRT